MKRIMMAAAMALVLAPAALAQTQAEMVVGKWTCFSNTPDGLISGQMEYMSNGSGHSTLIMAVAGMNGQVIMDITSTWRAPGDGTLREKVTNFDVVRFQMDGKDMDASALKSYGADMMKDELQSGSLQITKNSLAMIDVDGVVTSCMR